MKRLALAAVGLALAAILAFGAGAFALFVWPGRGSEAKPRATEYIAIAYVKGTPFGTGKTVGSDAHDRLGDFCKSWKPSEQASAFLNDPRWREHYARPNGLAAHYYDDGFVLGEGWRGNYEGGGYWSVAAGCQYFQTIGGTSYWVLEPMDSWWFDERTDMVD